MTEEDLAGALRALSLMEADVVDVRIVDDGEWGRLVLARLVTAKHGTHLVVIYQPDKGGPAVRIRLSPKLAVALREVALDVSEDDDE